MRILFVCNQNQNRSKTAEELFRKKFETQSAGLYNEKPLTLKQLEWAELIVVMEDAQRKEISKRFPVEYLKKRIVSLDVPDIYYHNQPELVSILNERVAELI